ncbi:hypothetical protein [Halopiger aswanensis]|uniref:Uncharacterized protein n=1 Tax=Halopiger aswanensis TaxID=148449 RepID=A0A3R7EH31_9EURY|nr:hypothetical protein [Halopiger aswanensis]RKD97505.1 hypothetical protein ATJ93_0493 [Halopiger aswanensis]
MALTRIDLEHPSWLTAASTIAGYLVILAILTVALFVVPWLVFATL